MFHLCSGRVALSGVFCVLWAAGGCGGANGSKDSDVGLSHTHFLIGADYFKKKQPLAAKRELLKALSLDPANQEAQQLLGSIFFFEGVHKMNLVEIEQCLRGEEAEEQRNVANEDFRRSEQYLTKSVKLAETNNKIESSSLVYLANISLHFGRHAEAIARARQALNNMLYASRHLAHGVAGWAYFQKGELKEAGRELRQAIFHQPDFCLGRYRLAKVYHAQGNLPKAIEQLEQIPSSKECPLQEVPYLLGLCYVKQRALKKAKEQFEGCIRMNPRSCLAAVCRRLVKDASRGTNPVDPSKESSENQPVRTEAKH